MRLNMADININTDFTKLTNAELIQIKEKWDPVSQVYLLVVTELHQREQMEKEENKKAQQKNEKTQSDIKIMTAIIMVLTIIILVFTIAQFFKTP